jgi:hypothetical protein
MKFDLEDISHENGYSKTIVEHLESIIINSLAAVSFLS